MFSKFIKKIKDYLTFNKSERRGLLVLSVLILILIIINILLPYFNTYKKYDYSEFDKQVSEFLSTREIVSTRPKTYKQKEPFNIYDANTSAVEQKLNPFAFDPNTLSYEGFIQMGFLPKQAITVIKYRTKGGRFYKKEDFSKMYCISKSEYQILEPFIEIKSPEKKSFSNDHHEEISKVDINTATEEQLMQIKGIGNYFAKNIIKYRSQLGGYYSKEQLLEIPKMDSEKYEIISPYLEVNMNAIHKINVNTATFDQLKQHSYIGYNIALSLINYREKHGSYKNISDIKKSALITDKNYPKISCYLCTE